jgi:hypothetical protein
MDVEPCSGAGSTPKQREGGSSWSWSASATSSPTDARWLERVVSAEDAAALVWSTDPADAALFALAGSPHQEVLAWFAARVGRGEVELIEEKIA